MGKVTAIKPRFQHPEVEAVWTGDNERLSFYAKNGSPQVGAWYDSVFVDIVGLWNDEVGIKAWGWQLARSIGGHVVSGTSSDWQEAINRGLAAL
jgi:hypothetical protein